MEGYQIGLIGLAVMGQNLVLNMLRNGYRVAVYNRTWSKTEQFLKTHASEALAGGQTLADFVKLLEKPRKMMLMVQAGQAVDDMLEALLPYVEPGDVIIDGGNSYFRDTMRRAAAMESIGIHFLGMGISGGEEGALNGPSIMPGGSKAGWALCRELFTRIAACVDGIPCCDYIGENGAGHYVKMTHNGIEYGDMQLIGEAYAFMRDGIGLNAPECAGVFEQWNQGVLDSYLIEITAQVLRCTDDRTGKPLIDFVRDRAGQKGTGKWTGQEALDLGVAAPTITDAVFARCLSAARPDFTDRITPSKQQVLLNESTLQDVQDALYAAKICSYAQGFSLLKQAAQAYDWPLDYGNIAMLWRGGCIIRARFLSDIKRAYEHDPALDNLLQDPFFAHEMARAEAGLRRVVAWAAQMSVPMPCMMSALAYYDGYHCTVLRSASLIQAQRDCFGAHTYERMGEPGTWLHTDWSSQ